MEKGHFKHILVWDRTLAKLNFLLRKPLRLANRASSEIKIEFQVAQGENLFAPSKLASFNKGGRNVSYREKVWLASLCRGF